HLAFNLLALYVFGPEVEERMGGGPFLGYYLLCGLGGAVLSFVLMQFRPVELVIGASAAVYGVLLAFAWAAPDRPIYVVHLHEPEDARQGLRAGVAGRDRRHAKCQVGFGGGRAHGPLSTLVSRGAASQIGAGRSMLVNLVPEFLAVLAAPDPAAAYHAYLDRHRPVLASYWHNYVLD